MVKDKKPASSNEKQSVVPFSSVNYILFATGLVVITAGWFLLRAGHISLSPVMLILGYCVVIPAAIVLKPGNSKEMQ
jgi:hypothetical protein